MAALANGPPSGTPARQKRVLPSRSRRGGPGVGSCDVDLMILDTQKRKAENEPLIPANAPFLLTTDVSRLPSTPSPGQLGLNLRARERYFDRPEVIKTFIEQSIIQTPEFTLLSEDASVGGRFRPRGVEAEATDTSDAAYEKRHKKYETFEKRQRLREKEKLKHEQYKLKERIEQLRAMDSAAFMALPVSSFPLLRRPSTDADDGDDSNSLSNAHVNGAAVHNEGERRRKEMLDVAQALEERYRILLPPDRLKKPLGQVVEAESNARAHSKHDGESETDVQEGVPEPTKKEVEKLKLKIKFPARSSISLSSTSLPNRSPALPSLSPTTSNPLAQKANHPNLRNSTLSSPENYLYFSIPPERLSAPTFMPTNGLPLPHPTITLLDGDDPDKLSDSRPFKRTKTVQSTLPSQWFTSTRHPSVPPIESISSPVTGTRAVTRPETVSDLSSRSHTSYTGSISQSDRSKSVLMIAALRASSMPKSRKTQRHLTAFGTKVPPGVDEVKDFDLPLWIRNDDDDDHSPRDASYAYEAHIHSVGADVGGSVSDDTTENTWPASSTSHPDPGLLHIVKYAQ